MNIIKRKSIVLFLTSLALVGDSQAMHPSAKSDELELSVGAPGGAKASAGKISERDMARNFFLHNDTKFLEVREQILDQLARISPSFLPTLMVTMVSKDPTVATTMLYAGVGSNDSDMVTYALSLGANVNPKLEGEDYKQSPTSIAARNNNFEIVKKLVNAGANLNNGMAVHGHVSPVIFSALNEPINVAMFEYVLNRTDFASMNMASLFQEDLKNAIRNSKTIPQELKALALRKIEAKESPSSAKTGSAAAVAGSAAGGVPASAGAKTASLAAKSASVVAASAAAGSVPAAKAENAKVDIESLLNRQIENPLTHTTVAIRHLLGNDIVPRITSKAQAADAGFVVDETNFARFRPGELVLVLRSAGNPAYWGMVIEKQTGTPMYKVKTGASTEIKLLPERFGKYGSGGL